MSGHPPVPVVSVVVPARDEAAHLGPALEAVLAQDHPLSHLEVIVVDGASTDGTSEVARQVLADRGLARWSVVTNPAATTPSNLNVGLRVATGEYLCRVDARSRIPPHYVRTCVAALAAEPARSVVGGAQVAIAPCPGAVGSGIARALGNRWAMGLSRYRRGARSGPSDTVYLGFFRRQDLLAAGGWDEAMHTNQDFELNERLGGHRAVWFEAGLEVAYVPRPDLVSLWRQYHRFGRWKVRYWRRSGRRPRPRQVALVASPAVALAAGATVVARSPRRMRAVAALGATGLGMLLVVDEVGSPTGASGGAAERLVAIAAMAAVGSGWVSGVALEAVGGRR